MENLWLLRLYCDEKADDTFTIPLEHEVDAKRKLKRLCAPPKCSLIFDDGEFHTLTFQLIDATDMILNSYQISVEEMKAVAASKYLKKRVMRRESSGPRLNLQVAYNEKLGIRIKDILIKYEDNDLKISSFGEEFY